MCASIDAEARARLPYRKKQKNVAKEIKLVTFS
jgi:hypothetical protein